MVVHTKCGSDYLKLEVSLVTIISTAIPTNKHPHSKTHPCHGAKLKHQIDIYKTRNGWNKWNEWYLKTYGFQKWV